MLDDASVLLCDAGEKAGHVDEGDDGNVEGVAEADEPRRLDRGTDIEHAGQHRRLVRDHPNAERAQVRKPANNILGVVALHFVKHAIIDHARDDVVHIVGFVRVVRHDVEQCRIASVARVGARAARWIIDVVLGDVAEQLADRRQARRLRRMCEVRHARRRGMCVGAAQFLHRDVLVRHRLHDVRSGDEHVRRAAHHVREVGDRRRIHRAARAGPENGRDLRNHAGGERVTQKNVCVAAERNHTLLNAGAAGVVQTDHRCTITQRKVHHFADLLGERLRQGSAEHREVLRKHIHEPAVDAPVTGHHAVAVVLLLLEAKIGRAVDDEPVELDETAFVEQQVEAFPRGQLSFCMLRLQPRRPPTFL